MNIGQVEIFYFILINYPFCFQAVEFLFMPLIYMVGFCYVYFAISFLMGQ